MEIFQTVWTALTTPNEILTTILCFPIYFVDAIVNMLLFTVGICVNEDMEAQV